MAIIACCLSLLAPVNRAIFNSLMEALNTQKIITLIVSFSLALVIVYTGFLNSLLAFLIVGAVPGTDYTISPTILLAVYGALLWIVFFRASIIQLIAFAKKRANLQKADPKQQLPKRRYSRV